jgi:hypothetical protein
MYFLADIGRNSYMLQQHEQARAAGLDVSAELPIPASREEMAYASAMYVAKYITKPDVGGNDRLVEATAVLEDDATDRPRARGNVVLDAAAGMRSLVKGLNRASSTITYAATQAAAFLRGRPDSYCSFQAAAHNAEAFAAVLRSAGREEDDIIHVTLVRSSQRLRVCSRTNDYLHRPSALAGLSPYLFTSKWAKRSSSQLLPGAPPLSRVTPR